MTLQWAAGIIPYLVYYLLALTPTPVTNVVSNVDTNSYSTQITTPTPYVAQSVIPSQQETAVVKSHNLGGNLTSWIQASNWPSNLHAVVYRIVMCESGGNPQAVSPTGYVGLMQAAPWFHGYPPSDPVGQLNQGYEIYKKQGFGAWECY